MTVTKTPENKKFSEQKPRRNNGSNPRNSKSPRRIDTFELRNWLSELNLGIVPAVHVNGTQHSSAVITVDFGSPIPSIRLTSEQAQELNSRLRRLTKELYTRDDVNVRVSSDNQNGVHWSSVS